VSGQGLYLRQLELGPMQNFVYLIGAEGASEVAVVDPAWEVGKILATAASDGKVITHALVTHGHHDHINGLEQLLERCKAKIVAQKAEVDFNKYLRDFGNDVLAVSAGDRVNVGGCEITCVHTPGHTPGSQCFHFADSLVSGDTLFIGACGRCDFDGGDPEAMYRSLTGTLMSMDSGTVLYPGHNYADRPKSTLGEEGRANPYLQFHDLASFVAYRMRPRRPPKS
jgi:hydroxyacylglutathione hydrolase